MQPYISGPLNIQLPCSLSRSYSFLPSLQKKKTREGVLRHRKQSRVSRRRHTGEGEPRIASKLQNQGEPPTTQGETQKIERLRLMSWETFVWHNLKSRKLQISEQPKVSSVEGSFQQKNHHFHNLVTVFDVLNHVHVLV